MVKNVCTLMIRFFETRTHDLRKSFLILSQLFHWTKYVVFRLFEKLLYKILLQKFDSFSSNCKYSAERHSNNVFHHFSIFLKINRSDAPIMGHLWEHGVGDDLILEDR